MPNNLNKTEDFENLDVKTLGLSLKGTNANFRTFSPNASEVELLLFVDSENLEKETKKIKMQKDENGTFSCKNVDVNSFKYYKYRITNDGKTYDVCDIWHNLASADSVASQIANIDCEEATPSDWEKNYTNPFATKNQEKSYSDAIIYEMHIRDWSRAFAPDSTGKFNDITNALKSGVFANHLKDLGVTHVQILPIFDYAQTVADLNYNWGYNPYHYNVPEGRYVQNMKDGTDATKQMRSMVKAFHDAGIAVIMDVVYNHTSGTGEYSLYDRTCPKYFYRLNEDGSYSNGSDCGNEVATNHSIVKKYVIESLKHWMKNYHINGFRFDLMGCQEKSTMKEIYEELHKIDSNVMVYGEPWVGGACKVVDGCTGAVDSNLKNGVGAFDDDFRDAIKGAEFMGFKKGQVQGEEKDKEICLGLTGAIGANKRNPTGKKQLAIHYVECHDNFTLFDKLSISLQNGTDATSWKSFDSYSDEEKNLLIKQEKLSAGYLILSQGTIFLNGGQEFMRTKKGDPDSYSADTKGGITWTNEKGEHNIDDVNTIDLSFREKFSDVYKTYRSLIALRKANSETFGCNQNAKAITVQKGITKYTTDDFCVYFNATKEPFTFDSTGFTKQIDLADGKFTEKTQIDKTLDSLSFVILKK